MRTIALIPPRPTINLPRKKTTVALCSSCDGALNANGECRGCSE